MIFETKTFIYDGRVLENFFAVGKQKEQEEIF